MMPVPSARPPGPSVRRVWAFAVLAGLAALLIVLIPNLRVGGSAAVRAGLMAVVVAGVAGLVCEARAAARLAQTGALEAQRLHADNARLLQAATLSLLRREQEARQDAEAANRLKDEFLATLSHELRTPLNAIIGWAHLLRTGTLDEATSARALETIDRNAKAQNQLINDILDVSRIITGKLHLTLQPVDPGAVVEAALDTVRPAATAKQIQIEASLAPDAGTVSGDPDRLQQVVWNLLSNAIKFTPKGGKVQVRLRRVDSQALIVVADSGPGISPEFLPHVFERFRQGDASTTRSHVGLGLSLAIVRHLVELHGGTVEASSAGEGQGSTFSVNLPLISAHRPGERDGSTGAGAEPAAVVETPQSGAFAS